MPVERAGMLLWSIGTVALWACVFWVLTLFGLGARIALLDEDESLLRPLPGIAAPSRERLGPLQQYAEIGARPIFAADRRPQPFFINPQGEGEQDQSFDYILTSVLRTPQLQMAILQPTDGGESIRLKVGEAPQPAPAWVLASIGERRVVFNGPEGVRELELRVYDGVGGEPPTVVARAPVPGGQGATPVAGAATNGPGSAAPMTAAPSANRGRPTPAQVPELPDAQPVPNPAPGATVVQTPEAQVEAIRQRIEARRAQLRDEAQRNTPAESGKNP
jgi:general secretion pathway protein N